MSPALQVPASRPTVSLQGRWESRMDIASMERHSRRVPAVCTLGQEPMTAAIRARCHGPFIGQKS